jgi:hypothetical protein
VNDRLERAAIFLASLTVLVAAMNALGATDLHARAAAIVFALVGETLIHAAWINAGKKAAPMLVILVSAIRSRRAKLAGLWFLLRWHKIRIRVLKWCITRLEERRIERRRD